MRIRSTNAYFFMREGLRGGAKCGIIKEEGAAMKEGKIEWRAVAIVALCLAALATEFVQIPWTGDEFLDGCVNKIVQQALGSVAVILLMARLRIRLFGRVRNGWCLLPCLLVAMDNFPLYSYLQGNMQWVRTGAAEIVVFAIYCLSVGVFEECVFRGVLFYLFASHFTKDRKGLVKTYLCSSVVFGLAHLVNIVGGNVGGVLLQVGYSTLTGGLFAYALIKTQNVLCAGAVHGLYNFCGLVLSEQGLGSGVVFDFGTGVIMAIVSVIVGIFVIKSIVQCTEKERAELYEKMDIRE